MIACILFTETTTLVPNLLTVDSKQSVIPNRHRRCGYLYELNTVARK